MADDDESEAFTIPLQHQHAFGSRISYRPIAFVPAATPDSISDGNTKDRGKRAHDAYLQALYGKATPSTSPPASPSLSTTPADPPTVPIDEDSICPICNLPMRPDSSGTPHESTIPHLMSKPHSHPPSSIDRQRKGLSYLSAQGWDPDARRGLGADGAGRLYPVRAEDRGDRRGVGAVRLTREEKKKEVKLDAGRVRKMAKEDKARGKKIERMLYGNGEVEKYLGEDL